jgi:catechol 2,3-dioxygenase-like lactoylglutathione lyase family enzyme
MLGDTDAIATVAVKDLAAARRFYEDVLGLKQTARQEQGTASYHSGGTTIFVYPSRYAGTNRATAITWIVGPKLGAIVSALRAKGVAFEHYDDLPATRREGDVHVAGDLRLAWLKDPDGNVLALVGS